MNRAAGAVDSGLAARVAAEAAVLRQRALVTLGGALVAGAALLLAAGALALADARWLAWPRPLPALLWGVLLAAAGAAGWTGGRRLWARLAPRALATPIEREQGLRRGALVCALEVAHEGVLGAKGAADVARHLPPRALLPGLGRQWRWRAAGALGALLLGGALLWGARRAAPDGWAAVWHPWRAWSGALLPPLALREPLRDIPRGMPATVEVVATGRRTLRATWQVEGEPRHDTTVAVPASGVVALPLGAVRAPVVLSVSDGRSLPLAVRVSVADRGWVGDVALAARFPAYLGRPDEAIEPVPPLLLPRGTRLRLTAVLRGGLTHAGLAHGRDTVWLMPREDVAPGGGVTRVVGTVPVDGDATWAWVATDGSGGGLPPELPDALPIRMIPDALPEVAVVGPMADTTVAAVGEVPLRVLASDDHAVGRVWLEVRTERAAAGADAPRGVERIEVATPQDPAFDGGATIPLEGRRLEPGDRLLVVAVAEDASPWRQQARTAPRALRVPSLAEQREAARSLGDSLAARAAQLAAQEARLQRSTAEAARSRELAGSGRPDQAAQAGAQKNGAQPGTMRFSAAERAKQLAREQQQLGARVDSLRQGARELEQRLRGANAMDTTMASRMRDIQRMLRDAMTPEMQKMLEQVNQGAERLSGTEAQQSLEQLARQQQQMREQLARSAEMLKRAALEGSMQTLRDDARDLARAERELADRLARPGRDSAQQGARPASGAGERGASETDPRQLAERTRALEQAVQQLAQRLEEAGARPGASRTRAAEPRLNDASDAMEKLAREQARGAQGASPPPGAPRSGAPPQGSPPPGAQSQGSPPQGSSQAGSPPPGSPPQGRPGAGGGQGAPGGERGEGARGAEEARRAADAMAEAAQQLADAREAQVEAWKGDLSKQLDRSINETMQLARQQAQLAERARQEGARATAGDQGALQQGVQQAAERLEEAGRSSSLLSQRTQKAMAEAQRKVQQATQAAQQAGGGQPGSGADGGGQQAQDAMKEATEALNQALSSLVRDRERVNSAQSGSGFTEMVEQLRQLAQQQGNLNGQMQGLNLLSGGAKGQAAQQQVRVLARQQREVARTLTDVSDLDQTGRTDALAREAQALAQQLERSGLDPATVARQQQLYRRLLDAGRLMEQDDRDDQGPRESRAATPGGVRRAGGGPASGAEAVRFAPPTWNDLRGLSPEERRVVVDYFRRLNGGGPPR